MPGDDAQEGFVLRNDFIAMCGGLRQAFEEILRWPTTHACRSVALVILCRHFLRHDGRYERVGYTVISDSLGLKYRSTTIGRSVAKLHTDGLLRMDERCTRRSPIYYFRKPEHPVEPAGAPGDDSQTGVVAAEPSPTTRESRAAPPEAGLAMSDVSDRQINDVSRAHGIFLSSFLAGARDKAKSECRRAERGDSPLVDSLCELLGADDRFVWCRVQATITRARRSGAMRGKQATIEKWVLHNARACASDGLYNPSAAFTKWFRNQPAFATNWAQDKGADDG